MENEFPKSQVAETFPPGDFIREELEARGWSQIDLAEIIGRDVVQVNRILQGKQAITPETAKQLAGAFDTSPEIWMNLETAYRLSLAPPATSSVARRAQLYQSFPVRDMLKRRWIEASDNIEVLEKRFEDFFASPDAGACFAHAARQSSAGPVSQAQRAWLFRARQLARAVSVGRFSETTLRSCLEHLGVLRENAEDVRLVPRVLADYGIRFLIVEALPGTKIDGVCFWLDSSAPVVVLSLRYDRIDSFWFTLMHELGHVHYRDGLEAPTLDIDLVGEGAEVLGEKSEQERRVDEFARESLVRRDDLEKFIARIRPFYYKKKIALFANRLKVHPGIIVGQLHNRKVIQHSYHREMLEKVRDIATSAALTDGWGNTPSV